MSRLIGRWSEERTAFFCCDLQQKFAPRIPEWGKIAFIANRFAQVHKALERKEALYLVTEQYPQGLGKTAPDILVPSDAHVLEKQRFSMIIPEVTALLEKYRIDNVVLFGIESHVCVLQTAAELLDANKRVFIPRDGIASQNREDEDAAVELMKTWGPKLVVSTSESIIFQLARSADDPMFRKLSAIVKERYVK